MTSPRGFTLVELLFVIAIISLLTSLGLANMQVARAKTIDTAKRADMTSVRTALRTFHLDKGRMPYNYRCTTSCVRDDSRSTLAIEDTESPENPQSESGKAYRASMQELVDGKYLSKIPKSPGGAGYVYYDYGSGSPAGAVIGTDLAQSPDSAEGEHGTCRPFNTVSKAPPANRGLLAVPLLDAEWEACWYEEDGLLIEDRCPEDDEDDDTGGVEGPSGNFCSSAPSSNYCLCSKY